MENHSKEACHWKKAVRRKYFDIDKNEMMKTNESYSPLYIPPSREVENVNGIFYDLIDREDKRSRR